MKTVGIIGGLSPESTVYYYNGLNQGVRDALGGLHSAKILLSSVDFGEFVALKKKGDWETQGKLLTNEAARLEKAGADFVILATNTMHKMADEIQAVLSIPLLHLADATAMRIKEADFDNVGLLGTRYTMELDFYKGRLANHGIKALVPDENGRDIVNAIIYDELCEGIVKDESRKRYQEVIARFAEEGAQAVILGCTEITMLIRQEHSSLPIFDTTEIHIQETLKEALK